MKLRKFVMTTAAVLCSFCFSFISHATEADLTLSLDGDGKFSQVGTQDNGNGVISLGERLTGMAPGETRTTTTVLNNNCAYADFYINTETLDTFEENGNGNGCYDVQLSVTKNGTTSVIYDTTLGGYTETSASGAYGLLELNNNLDSYIFLTTMDKDESCTVTFSISLDGESVGNSYVSTDAVIDFDYQAVYMTPEIVTVPAEPEVQTVERKTTKYVTADSVATTTDVTTTIIDEDVPLDDLPGGVLVVKTGDTFELVIYIVLFAIALIIFLLTLRKDKKDIVTAIAVILLAGSFSLNVNAQENATESYVVTYRAGNVGRFTGLDSYPMNGASYCVVEANSYYVTFKVDANASYPNLPEVYTANGSYEINPDWNAEIVTGIVTKSQDLVVDYVKLTNPVGYSVTFVDANGNVLGTKNGRGNIGETVVFAKNFDGYRVADSLNSLTLSEDETLNELVITYEPDSTLTETIYDYTNGGTTVVYNDVEDLVYVPGTTTVVTERTQSVISNTNNAAGQTASATQDNTQNIQQENGEAQTDINNQNGNDQNGNNQVNNNLLENNQDENVIIPDEPSPLDPTAEEQIEENETIAPTEVELTTIFEEPVPKTDILTKMKAHYPLVIGVVVAVIVIFVTVVIIVRKKKIN